MGKRSECRKMFGLFKAEKLIVIAAQARTLELYQHMSERGVVKEVEIQFEETTAEQAQETGLWTLVYRQKDRAFYRLWQKRFMVEMESYDLYTSTLLKGEGYFAKVHYAEVTAAG